MAKINFKDITKEEYLKKVDEFYENRPIDATNIWDEGDEIIITDPEDLKNISKTWGFPEWMDELADKINQSCTVYKQPGIVKFKGICATCVDYYYIIEESDGKTEYYSCVGHINFKNG